jgi:hypothetical protein
MVTTLPLMLQAPGVLELSMLNVTDKPDDALAVTVYWVGTAHAG